MLPAPSIRWNKTSATSGSGLMARVDRYTLWAFNPQPVLADPPRLRSEDPATG